MKNRYQKILAVVFVTTALGFTLWSASAVKLIEDFEGVTPMDDWSIRTFGDSTRYRIVTQEGNSVMHARADSAASGYFKKVDLDPKEWPVLSWRWKVTELPDSGDVRFKETDDYGARVYVVFPRFLKWKTKTISYIWSRELEPGTSVPNPWLPDNVVMIAAQSGEARLGEWIEEQQPVYDDYKRIFGEEPPNIGAIAFMTDSDNTGGQAEAYYDDIKLLKE